MVKEVNTHIEHLIMSANTESMEKNNTEHLSIELGTLLRDDYKVRSVIDISNIDNDMDLAKEYQVLHEKIGYMSKYFKYRQDVIRKLDLELAIVTAELNRRGYDDVIDIYSKFTKYPDLYRFGVINLMNRVERLENTLKTATDTINDLKKQISDNRQRICDMN